MVADWALCTLTFFAQEHSLLLVIISFSCIFVSFQIISPNVSAPFRPCVNCSLVFCVVPYSYTIPDSHNLPSILQHFPHSVYLICGTVAVLSFP